VDESVYNEIKSRELPQPEQDLTVLTDDPNFEFPEENPLYIVDYSSQETSGEGSSNGRAARIVDGISGTYWHSRWTENPAEYPHFITLGIAETAIIKGVSLLQRDGLRKVKDIEILVKEVDGDWITMGNYELSDSTSPQSIEFSNLVEVKQIKVVMNSSHDADIYAAMDEITLIMQ
jgi:hypothetical protein